MNTFFIEISVAEFVVFFLLFIILIELLNRVATKPSKTWVSQVWPNRPNIRPNPNSGP